MATTFTMKKNPPPPSSFGEEIDAAAAKIKSEESAKSPPPFPGEKSVQAFTASPRTTYDLHRVKFGAVSSSAIGESILTRVRASANNEGAMSSTVDFFKEPSADYVVSMDHSLSVGVALACLIAYVRDVRNLPIGNPFGIEYDKVEYLTVHNNLAEVDVRVDSSPNGPVFSVYEVLRDLADALYPESHIGQIVKKKKGQQDNGGDTPKGVLSAALAQASKWKAYSIAQEAVHKAEVDSLKAQIELLKEHRTDLQAVISQTFMKNAP